MTQVCPASGHDRNDNSCIFCSCVKLKNSSLRHQYGIFGNELQTSLSRNATRLFSQAKGLASRATLSEERNGESRMLVLDPYLSRIPSAVVMTYASSISTFFRQLSNSARDTSLLSLKIPYHLSIDPGLCFSSLRRFQFSVSSQVVHKPFL